MSDEKPEAASEGIVGQSASTAGLERTFVSNEFDHPEHHWKWTPLEMRWINERITLAVVAEREACAKLCEEGAELCDTEWANKRPDEAAELDAVALTKIICASKIRERSNAKVSGGGTPSAGLPGYAGDKGE